MKIKLPKINLKIPKITIYGIDVIKNFLYFILYLIITLLAIAFLIAPAIKTFKTAQKKYFEIKTEYLSVKNNYNNELNDLNKLKKENRAIILKFKRDFDINNFKLFASKYMKIENIKKDKTKIFKKDFIKTIYYINAFIKSPKNFYDFVDGLKKYKNVIKVYFPIDFEKEKNDIKITLKIEHYRLKNKNALKAEENAH
ncbi:hypothetical protein [Caminibacter mediatlanticus]|uniref:Uncharacterized protein n=1 Tax=Caminibacter mediatlanticus TB-2 TaxID=391592 RepID=A0AAI9AJ84_9BACT|nr:hypothetical protein [Caminibacter mediatlanticus]EDM24643.1 hypothetical protein CMTB2_03968 [Caminibacter mediatlanticus TB-2]